MFLTVYFCVADPPTVMSEKDLGHTHRPKVLSKAAEAINAHGDPPLRKRRGDITQPAHHHLLAMNSIPLHNIVVTTQINTKAQNLSPAPHLLLLVKRSTMLNLTKIPAENITTLTKTGTRMKNGGSATHR